MDFVNSSQTSRGVVAGVMLPGHDNAGREDVESVPHVAIRAYYAVAVIGSGESLVWTFGHLEDGSTAPDMTVYPVLTGLRRKLPFY